MTFVMGTSRGVRAHVPPARDEEPAPGHHDVIGHRAERIGHRRRDRRAKDVRVETSDCALKFLDIAAPDWPIVRECASVRVPHKGVRYLVQCLHFKKLHNRKR